ncbi:MAG: glycosyltransferase family 39 protein [Planctomycetes bacterium]|nr:glycosyltransferase family 39 protein [Planctomycetota bacterium]MCC7395940.1 glycosyltransferase family 39 protein [Planctomycetota bacterium]
MLAPVAPAAQVWIHHAPWSASSIRRGRQVAWIALAAFALVLWFAVPHGIGASWRECDTQAIARNFVLDGFDPLRPRVDWRGDTDGAVECEFPLYQLLVASVLHGVGLVEWPGRVLSLLTTLLAAVALHRLLERRCGPAGAIAGLLTFLASGSAALLATHVVPDGLSLAFSNLALLTFVRYLATGGLVPLLVAIAATTLAGLQKPLALQVGLVLFGWTAALAPRRLRDGRLWLGLAIPPAIVAAWLVHGAQLHAETGLSFGVVSGGDTKFPDLAHLCSASTWCELLLTTLRYGFPVFAVMALAMLSLRRRLDAADIILLLASAAGLMVSLRYSSTEALGPHYHAFAAAAGAWTVARAWPERPRPWLWFLFLFFVAMHAGWRARYERGLRMVVNHQPIVTAARTITPQLRPTDRLLVRSEKPRVDVGWNRQQNIEDPRFFALTGHRGFVVAADEWDVTTLDDRRRRGATVVVDSLPAATPDPVRAWLANHGDLLYDTAEIQVHRLH